MLLVSYVNCSIHAISKIQTTHRLNARLFLLKLYFRLMFVSRTVHLSISWCSREHFYCKHFSSPYRFILYTFIIRLLNVFVKQTGALLFSIIIIVITIIIWFVITIAIYMYIMYIDGMNMKCSVVSNAF